MRKCNANLVKKQQKNQRYRKIKQVKMNTLQEKKNYLLIKLRQQNTLKVHIFKGKTSIL